MVVLVKKTLSERGLSNALACAIAVFLACMTGVIRCSSAQEGDKPAAAALCCAPSAGADLPPPEDLHSALLALGTPEARIFPTVFKSTKPSFKPGEELTFALRWKGFPVGTSVTKVYDVPELFDNHKVMKVETFVESNAFASMFFGVNDHSYSFIDAENGFSRFYYLDREEEIEKYRLRVEFDYEENVMRFSRFEQDKDVVKDLPMFGPVTDVAGAMFYYRQIPCLAFGDSVNMPLCIGKEVFFVKMKVDKKDLIKVRGLGTVKALKTSPCEPIPNGPALGRMGSCIWIDERTHLPLRVVIELPDNSITMYLVEANNVAGLKALSSKEIKAAKRDGY